MSELFHSTGQTFWEWFFFQINTKPVYLKIMQEKLVTGNIYKSNTEQLFKGDVSEPISFER